MEGNLARSQHQTELPLHPQDEVQCRRCRVHCEKVVHPAACVERSCPFAYAYEEWGRTYVGCMQRIFDVEIDLAVLEESRGRRDGFGGVRARRQPLPMCQAEVIRCYQTREGELGCLNPEFNELSHECPSFRVIAQLDSRG